MSDSKAVVQYDPSRSVSLIETSKALFKSNLFPHIKSAEAAFAIMQYGDEIGVGPMVALQNINFIQGKPVCNSQLMLARAYERGVTMKVVQQTDTVCELLFSRPNFEPLTSKFDMEDAKRIGLAGKDNWRKYPKDMLFWRAVSAGVRRIAPDAVTGAYLPEELTNGRVLDVTAEVVDVQTGEVMTSGSVTTKQWEYISKLRATRVVPEEVDADLTAWASGEKQTETEASEWIDKLKALPELLTREELIKRCATGEKKVYPKIGKGNNVVIAARIKYLRTADGAPSEELETATDETLATYRLHMLEKAGEAKKRGDERVQKLREGNPDNPYDKDEEAA